MRKYFTNWPSGAPSTNTGPIGPLGEQGPPGPVSVFLLLICDERRKLFVRLNGFHGVLAGQTRRTRPDWACRSTRRGGRERRLLPLVVRHSGDHRAVGGRHRQRAKVLGKRQIVIMSSYLGNTSRNLRLHGNVKHRRRRVTIHDAVTCNFR